jgi:hypothetical protein
MKGGGMESNTCPFFAHQSQVFRFVGAPEDSGGRLRLPRLTCTYGVYMVETREIND